MTSIGEIIETEFMFKRNVASKGEKGKEYCLADSQQILARRMMIIRKRNNEQENQ